LEGRHVRNFVLLLASLLFYSWGEPIYVILMLVSILNDYFHSIYIDKSKQSNKHKLAKTLLITSIVVNIGLLVVFKYSDFLILNLNAILGVSIPLTNIGLPIGISFYTFQTMSYTIDVYRGNVKVQKNILTLGTYVALFPQLIAGPIVRYIDIEEDLMHRQESISLFAKGLRRFIIGLGKKVIIANGVALIAVAVFDTADVQSLGFLVSWIGLLAYALQIYFDFSGYSDMAIGLGQMFGFNFPENFNYPYIANSITDFWKRWHISLSTWFREYVYIPLGGNRVSMVCWLRNILVVWFLTGFWHGASWNYILWGLYFALILILEKTFFHKNILKIPWLAHIYTIFLFLMSWVIFRIEDTSQILPFYSNLFSLGNIGSLELLIDEHVLQYILLIIIGIIGATPLFKYTIKYIEDKKVLLLQILYDVYIVIILLYSVMLLISDSFNPFIYFRF